MDDSKPKTQAERVFAKFGGATPLAHALGRLNVSRRRVVSAVYRWNLPVSKRGTGGVIPSSAMADVLAAARIEGIVLTAEDLDPRRR